MTSTNFPQGRNSPVQQYIDNYGWVKGTHQMRFGGEYRRNLATSYLYNTVFPRVDSGHQRFESGQPQHVHAARHQRGGTGAGQFDFRQRHRLARLHQPGLQPHVSHFRLR